MILREPSTWLLFCLASVELLSAFPNLVSDVSDSLRSSILAKIVSLYGFDIQPHATDESNRFSSSQIFPSYNFDGSFSLPENITVRARISGSEWVKLQVLQCHGSSNFNRYITSCL